VRSELRPLGIESFAVVLTGKVWIGSAGSETRREYMLIGEPLQLASQMLAFCTAEHPVLVDWPTSQANRSRFEFIERPMLVRVPGQLKQHAMLAVLKHKPLESLQPPKVYGWAVASWLQKHAPVGHIAVAAPQGGALSEGAQLQMREAFKELDHDGRGSISLAEILEVLRDIDVANPDAPHSITGTVGKTLQSLDTTGDGTSNFGDDDGRITFEHFLAAVAAASAQSADALEGGDKGAGGGGGVSDPILNLPLLLTAYTTRRVLQLQLGEGFMARYRTRHLGLAMMTSDCHG
jgi:hypothetical protein